MKNTVLLCLLLLCPLCLSGQVCNRLLAVCTYDAGESIAEGTTVPVEGRPLCFVTGQFCDDNSYRLDTASSFAEGVVPLTGVPRMLFFVHGNNVSFGDLFSSFRQIEDLYGVSSLFFAWPAKEYNRRIVKNYFASKHNLEDSFPQFLYTVDSLARFVRDSGIECSAVFHSLGNRLAELYAGYLSEDTLRTTPFTNIILSSACVPEADHARWVDVLAGRIANKVYVVRNDHDFTLRSVQIFLEGHAMLGGYIRKDEDTSKGVYIDMTNILKATPWRRDHSYYAGGAPVDYPSVRLIFKTLFSGGSPEESYPDLLRPIHSGRNIYSLEAGNRD